MIRNYLFPAVWLAANFFFLCLLQFLPPFKKTLKVLVKLMLLFFILLNVDATVHDHFIETRVSQTDLNGDGIFTSEEQNVNDHEFWFELSIRDTYKIFEDLLAPLLSLAFAIFLVSVYKGVMHFPVVAGFVTKIKCILNTGRSVNGRNLALSLAFALAASIAFFEYYFRTGMNEGSLLKIHDYEELMLWSLEFFCASVLYYFIVTKFFPFEFLFKLCWIRYMWKVFSYMYSLTFVRKTDTFLYMLVPLAGLIPAVIMYADNLIEKFFAQPCIKEKILCARSKKSNAAASFAFAAGKLAEKVTGNIKVVLIVWLVLNGMILLQLTM